MCFYEYVVPIIARLYSEAEARYFLKYELPSILNLLKEDKNLSLDLRSNTQSIRWKIRSSEDTNQCSLLIQTKEELTSDQMNELMSFIYMYIEEEISTEFNVEQHSILKTNNASIEEATPLFVLDKKQKIEYILSV